MSSSEICVGESGSVRELEYDETPRRDGPEKVPIVTKSLSLQEMRSSLGGISECEMSGEGGNSSGVFSCSCDISDVCMADVTKLSDSPSCSSSGSVHRSALPLNRESALKSTPVSTPSLTHHIMTPADVLTPNHSHAEFLSPQFGASDDYLRRNIKFIYKQLGSLMTQLCIEDKYFQTCSERYEEVIASLKEEIVALKSGKNGFSSNQNLLAAIEGSHLVETSSAVCMTEDDEAKVGAALEKASCDRGNSEILARIAHELLPQLCSIAQSASVHFPRLIDSATIEAWECELDAKEGNFEHLTTVFDQCISYLNKFMKELSGASSSSDCRDIPSQIDPTVVVDSGTESLQSLQDEASVMKIATADTMRKPCCEGPIAEENLQLRAELEKMRHRLAGTDDELDKGMTFSSNRCVFNGASDEIFDVNRRAAETSAELSRTERELMVVVNENTELKEAASLNERDVSNLERKLRELETEHKKVIEEFRIKGSGLILENSKLKGEVGKLHEAVDEAQVSSERSTQKFHELQMMYEELIGKMKSKEAEFVELENWRANLDALLKAKDSVLCRLCSNFNELLAIFRECQGLGLDQDSSANDIDDGFMRLKRRLLDLSQDYITLNNRNKFLEKELLIMTNKVREKEHEIGAIRRKYDSKCENLQRTLENMEGENKNLVSRKIELDDALRKTKAKVKDLELLGAKGCLDCGPLRNQIQQLQIDLVDKDATISTLELHIQSCCEFNRKKAQQYKHELHAYKRQMDAHSSYAVDFGLSPKKSKNLTPKVDVGIQYGESFLQPHAGGFVERFKIRELEERVIKLEKERTVLKRLCKIRSDRIHELEPQVALSLSNSPK